VGKEKPINSVGHQVISVDHQVIMISVDHPANISLIRSIEKSTCMKTCPPGRAVHVTTKKEQPAASQHWTPGVVGVAVFVPSPAVSVIVANVHCAHGFVVVVVVVVVVVLVVAVDVVVGEVEVVAEEVVARREPAGTYNQAFLFCPSQKENSGRNIFEPINVKKISRKIFYFSVSVRPSRQNSLVTTGCATVLVLGQVPVLLTSSSSRLAKMRQKKRNLCTGMFFISLMTLLINTKADDRLALDQSNTFH
jgi:hypothetical protein